MQARLERTAAGRALISILLVVMLACIAVTNLPASQIRARLYPLAQPVLNALGLDQNWGVFAPNPRRNSLFMFARVRYADGSEETLTTPRGGRLVGGYWDYRWRKWAEWTTMDEHSQLWQPAAAWFAQRARAQGRDPVNVTLVRRWRELLPPGPGPSRGDWHEYAFYTYDVARAEEDESQ